MAAYLYSHRLNIPAGVAVPVAAAFLVEISLYAGMNTLALPAPVLWASAALSYLIYSIPTGVFHWQGLLLLAAATGAAIAWMRYAPPSLAADAAFVILFAALYISKALPDRVYLEPLAKLQTGALAQLMCFRLAVTCLLRYRSHPDFGFGWLPTAADWRIGLRYFCYLLPVAMLLVWLLHFRDMRIPRDYYWRAPATFLGIFFVVALGEECLFRGLILHRLRAVMPPLAALMLSSVVFGITHLWFSPFPNWKFAILASVCGVFYGSAYLAARGVRAAMVTHALTVAAWRTFLA